MEFKYIHIENFKAIKDMTLDYTAGLWEVVGVNEDGPYISNGSSKTTALEAIQQCLFNRTTLNIPIEDVGRKTVGSSDSQHMFKLTTEFTKDGSSYKVVNDRAMMKITIWKDSVDLGLKSIPQALKRIQLIIGMDINTFITLTFITHTTISDLLENFSSSSLMKIILDFNQITDLDKRMKAEVRIVNESVEGHRRTIKSIEDSLEILSQYKEIDTFAFHKKKGGLVTRQKKLNELLSEANREILAYQDLINETAKLHKEIVKLGDGSCPTCGQDIDIGASILRLQGDIDSNQLMINSMIPPDAEAQAYTSELTTISNDIQTVSAQLIAAETTNQIYKENKEKSDGLRETLFTTRGYLSSALGDSDILTSAIALIKKGDLHRALMASFVSVLNKYLDQFRSFVNLPYVAISAEANKANVAFLLHDTRFSQNIHLHTLSGGEKTRLRLILLLAMLYTIKDMTNASTNLLIFDESLDTLDASASNDLARLFDYLIAHDNKFIALISHGQQLADIDFSGKLTITKSGGIATLTKDIYG